MATAVANSAPTLEHKVRPAKPDEDAFKSDLAQAEKEHSAVQEKLVCVFADRWFVTQLDVFNYISSIVFVGCIVC